MRNVMKASTIESKVPLLAVEGGCIISKDADITAAFRVELPELFTVTGAEYEAMHAAWCKAVKVLPEYSVVLKQDWFIRERYRPEVTNEAEAGVSGSVRQEGKRRGQICGEQASFLSRSYERHFNERPFLNHACFLYLTKTTKERARMQSDFSTLCRGNIIPKEVNPDTARAFLESADQFERIMNDSGLVTLTRLTDEEITGTPDCPGLIEKYFSLSLDDTTVLQDMELKAEGFRVGNKHVCLHTLSDTDDLPGRVSTESRYERLSTDRSDCLLWRGAPPRRSGAASATTRAASSPRWSAAPATTRWTPRRSTGRPCRATQGISPPRSRSTPLSSRPCASLRARRTTARRAAPSGSRCATA